MQKNPNLRTTGPFYLIQSVLICSSGFVTCKWKTKKRFPNQWYSSQLSCKQWNMVNTTQKKPILRLNPENRPFFQAGNIRQHFRFYFSDHYQNPSTVKKKKKFIQLWEIFRVPSDCLFLSCICRSTRKLESNLSSANLPSPGKSSLPSMKRLYPHCLSKTSGSIFRAKISDEYKQLSLFFGYRT